MAELSEQEQIRRNSLNELRRLGINPYPAPLYEVNAKSTEILENFPKDNSLYQQVSIAGRIMSRRIMGAASFVELQDPHGRIQLYVKRDEICPDEDKTLYNTVFKRLLDIGDIIGVTGFVFVTQMGETSIHVKSLTVLSKSLRPLPIVKEKEGTVFDAFSDPEQRYRMRYVDLIVNPRAREVFRQRSVIVNTMREYFNEGGYMEVETPVLQPIPGGASARPFITHHNSLDTDLYLRIACELYLKRLIVGGYEGVYEFSKNFRNEGMDRTHNPEFTCVELYVAYKDYKWMMEYTEQLFERIALKLNGHTEVNIGENIINFKAPYRKAPMLTLIEEATGINLSGMDEAQIRDVCKQLNVEVDETMGKGKLIDAIFGEKCEGNLIQPTFVIDYPVEMSPLCKRHREDEALTERFELFINGKEVANAYSELNDPIDQLERFQEQMKLSAKGDDEAMFIDMDVVRAVEYGMPPSSGFGIGVDRLVMMMTGEESIQEVLLFPQMRPEKKPTVATDAEFQEKGIPAEWVPVVRKAGISTLHQLKEANANKLFNDLNGLRKKNKLDIPAVKKEEVEAWINA